MASGFGFFDPLIDFQVKAWNQTKAAYTTVFNWLKAGYAWIVGIIYGFIVITDRVIALVVDIVSKLGTLLGELAMPESFRDGTNNLGAGVSEILQVLNYFYPVDESLTLMATASVLFLGCMAYRFVKSWIPTVS